MSSLMSDVIEGTVSPSMANAATKAGSQLLRLVELQFKYGKATEQGRKELVLSPPPEVQPAAAEGPSAADQERLRELQGIKRLVDEEEKAILARG